jgi:hypothetical protein
MRKLWLTHLLFALVGLWTCPPSADAAENDGGRFRQDRFAIGAFWLTFPDDEKLDERFREIAAANFTLVFGPVGGFSAENAKQHIELCGKHDLRAIVLCRGVPDDKLPAGPACWGYRLWDEPNANMFDGLAKRVEELRKARPGRLGYINLYPNYANSKQLGADNYEEYVKRFVDTVDIDILCMDHYPPFKPKNDGRRRYCQNLETMRKYSLQKSIPFWNYFNVMPFGPHTDPTESQIRWQIYTSLAYGAKGVIYFNYGTPKTFEFPKGSGIVRRDGTRSRHWFQARRINRGLKNLGPTLMQLTSRGVYRVEPGDDPASVLAGTPLKTIVRADVDPDHDYLVGAFQHADGRRAVLLNNYRFAYTAWPTVEFDAPAEQVREIDKRTGKAVPAYDDSPEMPGLQISLDAGEGRLFLLPPKSDAR